MNVARSSISVRRALLGWVWCVSVAGMTSSVAARVEVNVTHVGFPGVGRGDVVRAGCWTPVLVDLALVDQAEFHGSLRVAQVDDDGDRCFDSVEVHLRSETGGAARRTLYVPANPTPTDQFVQVELRDADGVPVQIVSQGVLAMRATPADAPYVVSHDDILALSVGTGTVGRIKDFAVHGGGGRFKRPIVVAHASPDDLPDLWIGFEAVDYIVWDDARPEELAPRKLDAIIEWVRHGGTLLIAAGRTAASLPLVRPLDAILPVDIGDIVSVANLPVARKNLLGQPFVEELPTDLRIPWHDAPFPEPAIVARCRMRNDAIRIARETIPTRDGPETTDLVTRRREQRGHVVFCAVALRDLFSGLGNSADFFQKIFHWLGPSDATQSSYDTLSLFNAVTGAVGFVASRSAYLAIATLFSVTYVALATFGAWAFLSSRGWRHHSWTAFALVAAAAGAAGVLAVGSIRGITDQIQQLAVIDADAGDLHGRATVFFGLKSGVDKTLDLWLPSDWLTAREPDATSCFLKPLPTAWNVAGAAFADPVEYRLKPAGAEIENARFRATLKRFEGRWEGPLGGKLTGRIAVRRGLITDDSYVVNNLGVDLTGCRLIQTVLNPGDVAVERGAATYVFALGDIPADGLKVYLAPRCYAPDGSETVGQILQRSRLRDWQTLWSRTFRGLMPSIKTPAELGGSAEFGQERDALMLLSTLGDFDPAILTTGYMDFQTWSADRLRQLDLRDHLRAGRLPGDDVDAEPGVVVLVGFAEGGGPVRLFVRSGGEPFAPIHPSVRNARCMYRIRIPFTLLDPTGSDRSENREP